MRIRIEIDFASAWNSALALAGKFNITHFLLLYFAAHLLQIAFPSNGGMVFDEAHYVPASLSTLQGIGVNSEHMPLSKIISAVGIAAFGNNWFGWRFPQVLMQIMALYLFYLIAKRFLGDPWALGATMLLGLDTLFFIHGGILLLDTAGFLFGFLAIELYLRKRYGWSAATMGLALLAREMAVFMLATLAVYHLAVNRKALRGAIKVGLRYMLLVLLVFGIVLSAYDAVFQPPQSMAITSIVQRNIVVGENGTAITTIVTTSQSTSTVPITNAVQHVLFWLHYHGPEGIVINETDRAYFHPLLWILPVDPFDCPTYYRVDVTVSSPTTTRQYAPIWYRAQPNLPLWYGIWPAIGGLLLAFKRKNEWETALFIAVGILSNYLPWVGLDMLRGLGFNYMMIFVLPYIALALAFTFKKLPSEGKAVLATYVLAELIFFIWFFPVRPIGT